MQKNIITYIVAIFVTLAVSATAWAQSSYSNAVMALNPAGYWPLNETSAPPQVLDLTATNSGSLGAAGNGYYGAWYQASGNQWYLTNNTVLEPGPTANGDKALNCQFAPGQYIIVPRNTNGVANAAVTIKPPFTLEAWVNPGTTAGRLGGLISEGEVQVLAGGPNPTNPFYGSSATGTSWAGFALGQYQNYFFFSTFNTNAYNNKASELDTPHGVTFTTWVYLVATFDGSTETIYTNGVFCVSKAVAANVAGLKYVPDLTSPLMIGSGSDVPVDYGTAWTGGVGEAAIYNEVLPQSSITAHYQTGGGTNATFGANYAAAVAADGPIVYYRMNDNQAPVSGGYPSSSFPVANNYGSLGTVANGVYQQGTTPGVAGPSYPGFGANSKSVAINGWLGAVDVGNSNIPAALNPTGKSALTVVSWFQGGPADAPGRFQEILGHSDNSYRLSLGQFPNVDAHFNPGPGPELQFSSAAQSATNGFAFNDGQWHMIVGVSDGTNDYLYLDGALALSNNTPTGISITGTNDDLLLGGDPEYTTASDNTAGILRNFDGQIAQVSYFTNALAAAQIQTLFNAAEVPPYIWQQPSPTSTSINAGQNLTISTGIRGSALTYQWYTTNGVAVAGQTGANLVFSPIATNDAGSFYVIASSSSGSVTSSVVNITVFGPPFITQQTPTQLNIFSGSSPTLHVTAGGAPPLIYQWTLGGAPISGATNSAYTLTNLQASGTYGCSVTNVLGSNSIAAITVTVLTDPTAPYPVHVLANSPLAYYRLDEAPGATTAFDYVGGLNGTYSNVENGLPGYTSQNPSQTDTDPNETSAGFGFIPSENPNNDYAGNVPSYLNFGTPNGSNAEFTVEAWVQEALYNGNGDCIVGLGYGGGGEQFVLDTGATASGFLRFFVRNAGGTVSAASSTSQLANDGLWHHVVGVCDEANGAVNLYLDGKQVATGTITNRSGLLSSTIPLSIGARESANNIPVDYDYQFLGLIDDVSIYNKALTAAQVQSDYYASGIIPLDVQVQPSSVVANQGTIVTFTSSVQGGTPPLSYQWFDNNNNEISGATNTSLSLTNVQPNQSGNYSLTVMNAYGSTNVQASLSVNQGPATISVDIQPTNVTAYAGDTVTFSIVAGGSAPLYYQWFQDGVGVSGATNASYSFAALAGTNTYFCTVSNAFSYSEGSGPVHSSTATVAGEAVSMLTPANYNSKLKIAFTGYNRSETLSYFPVLVRLSTNLMGFSYAGFASATGNDLRFADSSGTRELPYEVDQWDDSNGVSSIWVQVPQLSSTNFIWAYWGNTTNTTAPAYTTNGAVWEPASFLNLPDYDVVYHLQQTGFPYLDSTTNYPALDGVAPTLVGGGIVGYGQSFNGTSDYLDAGDVNLGTNFTESVWVNLAASASNIQGLWVNGAGGYATSEAALFINDYNTADGALLFGTDNEQPETSAGLVTVSQWHLLTAAVNRPAGSIQFYVDGNPEPISGSGSAGVSTDFATNTDMNLGRFNAGAFPFKGIMDEARIHGGIDDSNWVWADYMTVASNSVFSAYSTVSNTFTLPSGLSIQYIGGNKIVVSWQGGTLQSATQLTGPYANVPGATSPYTNTPSGQTQFYRLQGQF
jgi:hypothetical protein